MKKCERCDGEIANKGVITSGNSRYVVWKCKDCGYEKLQCLGPI